MRERLIAEDPRSAELIKPFLAGRDIKRYQIPEIDKYLIFIATGWTREKSGGSHDAWGWLRNNYPAIADYLLHFAEAAQKRYDKGEYWWELRACDYYDEFEKPKIMYLVFQVKPAFTFDEAGTYANNAVWITPKSDKTLLGILNSKLGWFMISNYCTQIQNGYQLIFNYLGKIPIRTINVSDPQDVARHDHMVSLVDQMLSLHKQIHEARTPHEQTALQRQIEATDHQIDALVYELYGLTEEEIKIVEKT